MKKQVKNWAKWNPRDLPGLTEWMFINKSNKVQREKRSYSPVVRKIRDKLRKYFYVNK